MGNLFYDTETCGYHGPIVSIQYAIDDSEIFLYSPWKEKISTTIELIEEFMTHVNIGFNLAFDHFHLCQMYTTLLLMSDWDAQLDDCLDEYAIKEEQGRFGPCLKPENAFDIMLHARSTEYQSTMDRGDIKIKRVPTPLAWQLAAELGVRIPLKDIYFARRIDPTIRWQVRDILDDTGEINPDFKDIVLSFSPSSALKALAYDALGIEKDTILLMTDVEVHKNFKPVELGYAPFCTAVGSPGDWKGAWPDVIKAHINHWTYNTLARHYASDDVKYTWMLYDYFDRPHAGDDDSILACMVGAVRWRGFKLNIPAIKALRQTAIDSLAKLTYNFNAPAVVKKYLFQVMSDTEKLAMRDTTKGGAYSTKAVILEDISKWRLSEVCECCGEDAECVDCHGEGLKDTDEKHPAAIRAEEVLDARHRKKEIELYNKLIVAGRFHASFKVVGTLSSRMSGSDGLNPQGIKRDKTVRACFPLADLGLVLCGGDFAGFEVVLIDAVYGDPILRDDLQSGKKIHALFGQYLFPTMSYDEIVQSKGAHDPWQDYYTRSKNGVFALCYGGEAYTLSNRVGVPEETAAKAYAQFTQKYKKFGEERTRYFDMFCVTIDIWVQTSEGPRQVKDLLNKECTIIVNGNSIKTEGFFYIGQKEVFEIQTKEGYKLEASEEHPLFVNHFQNLAREDTGLNIWTKIKDIPNDSKINLAQHPHDITWNGEGDWCEGYLLGLLYGDGTIYRQHSRLIFYYPDFCLMDFVISCFKSNPTIREIPQTNCYIITSSELDNLIEQFGIEKHKEVNEFIEQASSSFYQGFLSGFFDAGGTAKSHCKEINLHQSDLPRLEAVQRMLSRLGICSSIMDLGFGSQYIQGRKCNVKQRYRLYIVASNVTRFADRVGFMHPDKKANMRNAIEKCSKKKMYREDYLATVQSITSKGIKNVYDIEVPNIHYFDANGIMAHNCSMKQPNGLGTKVEWHEPSDYIESIFGFRRYFTLENQICEALFNLAEKPPKSWESMDIKVVRRDRIQTACGAMRSALFAAAFAAQASNMRAAGNHVIQSSGAQITKRLQRRIWDIQPAGVAAWRVQPMNIHDEIMCPTHPDYIDELTITVETVIDEYKPKVPLIEIDWTNRISTWADK